MVDTHNLTRKWISRVLFFLIIALVFSSSACSSPDQSKLTNKPTNPSFLSEVNPTARPDSGQLLSLGQDLRFENISLEEGLSQSTVFSIVQDKQGFLWFGTEDGLNKFDGYNFTVYKYDPENDFSLSSNWIEILYLDQNDNLWIGTANGLNYFNPDQETLIHYKNDPDDPKSISGDHITSVIEDSNGYLWVGTVMGGINKFDPNSGEFTQYKHNTSDPNSISSDGISTIFEDKDGFLWVGTFDAGINLLRQDGDSWTRISSDPENDFGLPNQHISTIIGGLKGDLWIGMDGGGLSNLVLSAAQKDQLQSGTSLERINYQFQNYPHDPDESNSISSNNVTELFLDNEGLIWVGTKTGGLNVLIPDTGTFKHFQHNTHVDGSLGNNWVLSIYQDNEGVYWFGTVGAGVNKLGLGWKNFPLFRNIPSSTSSLGDNMVRSFLQDQNTLWIGSMFGGLDRLNTDTGDWQHFLNDPTDQGSLSSNFVSTVYRDHSGAIWAGTSNGLDRYDPEADTYSHYLPGPGDAPGSHKNNIRAIFEKPTGNFWIGTRAGLYHFDLEQEIWTQINYSIDDDSHDLNNVWILIIMEGQDGMLWVSTWGAGLFRIDPETRQITHFHHDQGDPGSISSNQILSGYLDESGAIWFGTTSGLSKYNSSTDTFTNYGKSDGLPNETIYCILGDSEDTIWMSTNRGISKFDPSGEVFTNFFYDDGLQSNEFNGNACNYGINGEMLFGGINGFNLISSERIQTNSSPPPVVFTSLMIDGNEVLPDLEAGPDPAITLKWPINSFEFEYAALSFNKSDQNQYALYLEGFDDDWINIGSRRYGKYTNLPGGQYTLHVTGSNDDGIWNDEGASLVITVIPPFWGTRWFWGLILLAFIAVSFGGFKLRVRNLEKRGRELEIQVKDRTDQLMDVAATLRETDLEKAVLEERNRLARELHDSVTQSLYSLTLFTEAARHLSEATGDEKLEGYLGQIGILGLQALKEMRLLVFELGLHALEDDNLVEALEKRLKSVEGRTGVDAKVINDGYQKQPPYIETQLFKIAQEALNNALKHAEASSVSVHIQQEGSALEMEVIDDGIGFNPDSQKDDPGMGLRNIKERVDRMEGDLEIDSTPGKGTRLKVTINTEGSLINK